ncbi:hypothetical protein SAMN05216303_10192 [Rhodoferax sp. OV413]|uniref:hypothetical protein n=1 Tax=Rhodoferax sp. OV413 TaxID=1855285 RepID=UPI0008807742|nr:hypothetical protein [Rhodoferax sp. OV413]SDN94748.1 hypothetical protein SAMN05216303_10192 [Rhodoferax sp. OV413]
MRAIFSVLGLLAVVLVVSLLAKKQLAPPAVLVPSASAPMPAASVPQQYKQALDAALQQPRAMPDDKP